MKVLVYEDNLMWSVRLAKGIVALGHEVQVLDSADVVDGDLAIVNLGSASIDARVLAPALKARGIRIVAHAGHKESELLALGRDLGCDRLATNSELTHKLESFLTLS